MTIPHDVFWRPPPLIPLWRGVLKAFTGGQVAFIHTRRDLRVRIAEGKFPFFNRFGVLLNEMGYDVAIMPFYRPPYLRWVNRRCLHIYRGPGRPRRGPGVLHVAKGYLEGYWYLDPMGQRENSSIAQAPFEARGVEGDPALALFKALRRRYVKHGKSHRDQVERGAAQVVDGAIAIMLQRMEPGAKPRGAICTEAEMIRAVVAARGDTDVMIKFHPFGATRAVKQAVHDVVDPTAGVHLVEANVHDVLQAASMVCTQTSGVGFEALLHRTPTLVFAGADYHHCAIKVTSMSDLPDLIAEASQRKLPYSRYVYWFLEERQFRPEADDFFDRARVVVEQAAG